VNVFKMPVHPAAAVFPMLGDDDLDDLAADIKANGLQHPIIVKDGQLIDGRNRAEACKRAGVEPRIEELDGQDPIAYIISNNITRRHLTKGQRAMAIAKIYPDAATLKRKGAGSLQTKEHTNAGTISQARTVLAWLPQVADAVLAGAKSLGEAYAEAQAVKTSQDSEVQRLERLRERAPDLADLVDEARMRLVEAESAYLTRQEDARRHRQAIFEMLDGLERTVDHFAAGKRRADLIAHLTQPGDRERARAILKQWLTNLTGTLEDLRR
jgi:hypothetical protein